MGANTMAGAKKAKRKQTGGQDSDGKAYTSIDAVWEERLGSTTEETKDKWYAKAKEYWTTQTDTVDGMLGGYGHVSDKDEAGSIKYIKALKLDSAGVALDVGAGIGRVTKNVLLQCFAKADLLEANADFSKKARTYVGNENLDNIFTLGMEEFTPEEGRYALIWIQWCIIYLTDDDLVAFLQRCAKGLAPGGMIGIKDNVCSAAMGFEVDNTDNSVTRSDQHYKSLFSRAGLVLVEDQVQKDLPKELFQVRMYALQPEGDTPQTETELPARKKVKNAPKTLS